MIDKMMDAGIFWGIAALVGFAFSFGVLKIFKVKKPLNHKLFNVLLGVGILIIYILSSFIRTLIFDEKKNKIHLCYSRKVGKKWEQSVKNNIESDHRVKKLSNGNYQIYSWATTSESNLELPNFSEGFYKIL